MSLLQTTQFSSSVQISLTRFHNNFCYPIEIGGNLWLSRCHHWVVCVEYGSKYAIGRNCLQLQM